MLFKKFTEYSSFTKYLCDLLIYNYYFYFIAINIIIDNENLKFTVGVCESYKTVVNPIHCLSAIISRSASGSRSTPDFSRWIIPIPTSFNPLNFATSSSPLMLFVFQFCNCSCFAIILSVSVKISNTYL